MAISLLAGVLVVAAVLLGRPYLTSGQAPGPTAAGPPQTYSASVAVSANGAETSIPPSFLGLSTEYWALPVWERDLAQTERVLALLHVPGDPPLVLRIGGDSADRTMWAGPDNDLPDWAYGLTPGWLARTRTLVQQARLRVVLDLNLVTATPAIASQWAAAALHGLPRHSVLGFEVGNEADIYSRAGWLAVFKGVSDARSLLPARISARDYARDFEAYEDALATSAPGVPLLGPALANPTFHIDWLRTLLAMPHHGLKEITVHRYPYSACAFQGTRGFATLPRILSFRASGGVAAGLAPVLTLAHRADLPLRVTELNSVTCGGRRGVSNTFATALWAPDTLFALARAGVSAVNVHVRPRTINLAFAITPHGLVARPLLYGMLMFVRMLGPGARLVPLRVAGPRTAALEAWAVRVDPDTLHILLTDKSSAALRVHLRLPTTGPARVVRQLAPTVAALSGETLGGQALDAAGLWRGRPVSQRITPHHRVYLVALPPASEAMLSVRWSNGPTHSVRTPLAARPRGWRRAPRGGAGRTSVHLPA